MAAEQLEARVAALEAEVGRLKMMVKTDQTPWWKEWAGAFLNDPYFAKAMKYGRQYREGQKQVGLGLGD